MDNSSSIISKATSIVRACKLPELEKKIGDVQIEKEHFKEFRVVFDETLPLLFDIFHQNRNLLINPEEFKENLEFRYNFIKVLCEQTSCCTLFPTENLIYQNEMQKIIEKYLMLMLEKDPEYLLPKIFDSYQRNLTRENWKLNLGDTFGFLKFTEIFEEKQDYLTINGFETKMTNLTISVALALIDHHDPEYQVVGLKHFNTLLNPLNHKRIKESNIQNLIFKNTFPLIGKSKNEDFVECLWTCLYKIIKVYEMEEKLEFSEWNNFDDIMEQLLECLAFESTISLSRILLVHIIRFISMDLEGLHVNDVEDCSEIIPDLKLKCKTFQNYRIYRWIRKILMLVPNEIGKCGGSAETAASYLNGIHVLYLLAIYPIDPKSIETLLEEHLKNLFKLLMEVIKVYRWERVMMQSVHQFLTTINDHLHHSNGKILFADHISKLLNHEIFAVMK